MDITKALQSVGNGGKYQKFIVIFMCLVWIDVAYILLGPSYIFMNPTFICDGSTKVVEQNEACPKLHECQLQNTFTITAHAGLYCGTKQFQRNFIQSAMYIGSISGLVIMNMVSDKYGRKFAFTIGLLFAIVGSAFINLGAFVVSIALLVVGQILIGFGGYAILTISYVIISDFCNDKLRQFGIIIVNAAWALGQISFFLMFNYFNNWRVFTIGFVFAPLVVWLVLTVFFVVESPIYLAKNNKQKCLNTLNTIAEWNKTQPLEEQDLVVEIASENEKEGESVFEVFTKWKYLKVVLLISIFEITLNMFYYGTQYSMDNIGANFGVNMMIVGFLEFLAYFSSSFFIDKLPRKLSMGALNLVAGIAGFLFIFPAIKDSKTAQTIIVPFSRFLLTYCQGLIALFMVESFPDQVKSRGSGTIEAISNIGNFITPFIVSAALKSGFSPVLLVSLILLGGLIPLFFTKETLVKADEEDLKKSLLSEGEEARDN